MSRVTIHPILESTRAPTHEGAIEVPVAPAWSPVIWEVLHGIYYPEAGRFNMFGDDPDKLWANARNPAWLPEHRIAMAATFDLTWVARENMGRVVVALTEIEALSPEGVAPTIGGVANALAKMQKRTDILGICFHGTSVSEWPWDVYPRAIFEIDENGEEYEVEQDPITLTIDSEKTYEIMEASDAQ